MKPPMDRKEREALAAERAERYAPMPKGGSFMAGAFGAIVAMIADVTVSAFYSSGLADHVLITASVTTAGFLIGIVGYKWLAHLSGNAQRTELAEINLEQDERQAAERGATTAEHRPTASGGEKD